MAICNDCDSKEKVGKEYICKECGCFLDAKTRVPDEKCLNGKW